MALAISSFNSPTVESKDGTIMIDFEAPASFNSTPVLPILKDYLVVRLTGRLAKSGKVDGATDSNAADIWHRKIFLLGFAVILNLCFKHQRKQTKEIEQCPLSNAFFPRSRCGS